jgi:hypothetical protein
MFDVHGLVFALMHIAKGARIVVDARHGALTVLVLVLTFIGVLMNSIFKMPACGTHAGERPNEHS